MGVRVRAGVVALLAWAALTPVASAAPGNRDTSFGDGAGFVTVNFGSLLLTPKASTDSSNAIAVQAGGRILLTGTTDADGSNDIAIVALTRAGTIDKSYGGG